MRSGIPKNTINDNDYKAFGNDIPGDSVKGIRMGKGFQTGSGFERPLHDLRE